MVKKKIDNRIRVMIENGVKLGHRTMFFIIGDKARDQVPILYDILCKSSVKSRPIVLWCYKNKDEAISSHGQKRIKKIKAGKIDINDTDMFDAFRVSTTIHGRYYSDTHTILGKTYGVCVLQDFEALTPNLMARTIETVEGGGMIIFLLKTVQSLKQLYTMSMDVHKRFRTEAHQTVTCRFNERLILSLAECKRCLVLNDELAVLPISSKTIEIQPVNVAIIKNEKCDMLKDLKENLKEVVPAGPLVNLCKTYDQAKAIIQLIELLAEKQLKPPTCVTAARGRGKSAAMGLAIAAAISFGYVNVFVTSPHPENLITLFEFVLKGFDVLEYQEHIDYTIVRSTNPDFRKAIIRINITHGNKQTIQYFLPTDGHLLNSADFVVIDEAAAIPLPLIKKMLGSYVVFMSSTINGYEGTGRSLSLKLFNQLQKDNNAPPPIKLNDSIRYNAGDDIEEWLISLLCLNAADLPFIESSCPSPDTCELYYIDRDALFSYHKAAELFLHRIVSIYVASHYKNSPNDLQIMSDAPAHNLFCLVGPVKKKDQLPELLCVIQIALEGKISSKSVKESFSRGKKAAGDLIPWTIAEQFQDSEFPNLSGARIVRIATHPNYQRMGYGKRALELLRDYYEEKFTNLDENYEQYIVDGIKEIEENEVNLLQEIIKPRENIPTLLKRLTERAAEPLEYLGTSYGLTKDLLKFWKSQKFIPVYISQKENELTGEHSCIMISDLTKGGSSTINGNWLSLYFQDFRRRIIKLLSSAFRGLPTHLSLSVLDNKAVKIDEIKIDATILNMYFLPHDLQRLEAYAKNLVEYKLIADLFLSIAQLYFECKLQSIKLDALQKAILLGIGLQGKTVDNLAKEMNLAGNQILAKFHDLLSKISREFHQILKGQIEETIIDHTNFSEKISPLKDSLGDELDEEAKLLAKKQKEQLRALKRSALQKYVIKGTNEEWSSVLQKSKSCVVSLKTGAKNLDTENEKEPPQPKKMKFKNQRKHK
ncbi:RNA cytidine acetyltransferase [Condylostylus longicornis]|uniref:RNA cytidine acetyltransferase n=1 Tax=Condylostylus longicornis TaxID=2530218 RepID=UPI00244DDB3F|nr:RNA cytidine acetyltransferase [Condylostylus longicornis]